LEVLTHSWRNQVTHLSVKLRSFGEHSGLVFHFDEVLRVRLRDIIRSGYLFVVDSSVLIVSFLVKGVDLVELGLPIVHVGIASSLHILFSHLELTVSDL
jgi:hypothetical protein